MVEVIQWQLVPEDELLARLKQTRLKGFDRPLIYEHSTLTIQEQASPDLLVPAQLYVLRSQVQVMVNVAEAFDEKGIDVFGLTGALLFWVAGSDPTTDVPIPFLPPIIEESHEPDGRVISLINDGMHRIAAARRLRRKINIIHISNVPREYPYYAYPLSQGFDQVQEVDELTEGFKKKDYRDPQNYKALFRVFTDIFPGIQEHRPPARAAV